MSRSNIYPKPQRPEEWPVAGDNMRRFRPFNGQQLTMRNIHGPWRPSGAIDASGMFAVVWSTTRDQLTLVDMCRRIDRDAGYPGAWPEGRR